MAIHSTKLLGKSSPHSCLPSYPKSPEAFFAKRDLSSNRTGIPQVILPVWYDTYDFAERAERLGIGIYGNRRSAPGANAAEFGKALQIVVGDGRVRAEAIRERAMALAVICQKAGGRATACAKMMEMAGVSEDE